MVGATKAEKLAALAKLNKKPTSGRKSGEKTMVQRAVGGEVEEDIGRFWEGIRPNFGPRPESAHIKLSDEQRAALLKLVWVQDEARKMGDLLTESAAGEAARQSARAAADAATASDDEEHDEEMGEESESEESD